MITGRAVEVHALKERGWSISAIARHLDRDRKTVRAYLNGERVPGVRAAVAPDPLGPFAGYVTQRFTDDPHVWVTVLFDEVVELGFDRSSAPAVAVGRRVRPGQPLVGNLTMPHELSARRALSAPRCPQAIHLWITSM